MITALKLRSIASFDSLCLAGAMYIVEPNANIVDYPKSLIRQFYWSSCESVPTEMCLLGH